MLFLLKLILKKDFRKIFKIIYYVIYMKYNIIITNKIILY